MRISILSFKSLLLCLAFLCAILFHTYISYIKRQVQLLRHSILKNNDAMEKLVSPKSWETTRRSGHPQNTSDQQNNLKECVLDWKCEKETMINHTHIFENVTFDDIQKENPDMEHGGRWKPKDCKARQKIAIIIHLRNREEQLKTFIRNMFIFLKKQKADFTIFVIEQVGDDIFNRGQSIDAGFVEAQEHGDFDCFIFHDVDMLPINLCNIYRCEKDGVRHLGMSRDLKNPHVEWPVCIGGAAAFTKEQFEHINGFSTVWFGWGGEDDDAYFRIKAEKMKLYRYHPKVGNYLHLTHVRFDKKNFPRVDRRPQIESHYVYRKYDGLNTLTYKVLKVKKTLLLTRIVIQIPGPKVASELRPFLAGKRAEFQKLLDRDTKTNSTTSKKT